MLAFIYWSIRGILLIFSQTENQGWLLHIAPVDLPAPPHAFDSPGAWLISPSSIKDEPPVSASWGRFVHEALNRQAISFHATAVAALTCLSSARFTQHTRRNAITYYTVISLLCHWDFFLMITRALFKSVHRIWLKIMLLKYYQLQCYNKQTAWKYSFTWINWNTET